MILTLRTTQTLSSALAVALLLCTLSVQAVDVPSSVLSAQAKRIAAIRKASASTVMVFAAGGKGGGSGVLISPDGYALSNFHVVKPAGTAMKCALNDGQLYDAVVVGVDPVGDVALIKMIGRDDFPFAKMSDSDKVRLGDWCFAVGNPFLLATDFQPTVTYGIVSGVHRYQYPAGTLLEYTDCIQTDASINPGNSGGPLFNANGDLIGINGRGSFEKRGRVNVGVGYAISINQIKHFLGYLHSGRFLDHATLGANMVTDENGAVVVSNIIESSDAYRRGLRYGDQLLSFGGRPINTVNGFKNVLGIYPRGWRVPISFSQDGKQIDTFVRLAGVHSPEELLAKVQPNRKPPARPPEQEKPKDDPPEAKPPAKNIKKTSFPPAVAPFIEARHGYSNYYFNKLNQNRVWDKYIGLTKGDKLPGNWIIEGQIGNLGAATVHLQANRVDAKLPQGTTFADLDADLNTQDAPRGSGGMLVALHMWKHIMQVSPTRFGEVYYLGSMPTPKHSQKQDVLIGTHSVIECRYYFDPKSGHLTSIEMYPDLGVDPCELYFSDYKEVNGHLLPHHIEVVHGEVIYGELIISSYQFPTAVKGAN